MDLTELTNKHDILDKNEKGYKNLAGLVRGYFDLGGMQLQFNVVSNQKLREAQKHPEKYKDLLIRVAGYSAFFVDLDSKIQEDIIDRTEHGV
jgi:pyruvate-formate lyase